jgi:hypothetical protein
MSIYPPVERITTGQRPYRPSSRGSRNGSSTSMGGTTKSTFRICSLTGRCVKSHSSTHSLHRRQSVSRLSAASVADGNVARRDPTEHDVQIEILFCGVCHSNLSCGSAHVSSDVRKTRIYLGEETANNNCSTVRLRCADGTLGRFGKSRFHLGITGMLTNWLRNPAYSTWA